VEGPEPVNKKQGRAGQKWPSCQGYQRRESNQDGYQMGRSVTKRGSGVKPIGQPLVCRPELPVDK